MPAIVLLTLQEQALQSMATFCGKFVQSDGQGDVGGAEADAEHVQRRGQRNQTRHVDLFLHPLAMTIAKLSVPDLNAALPCHRREAVSGSPKRHDETAASKFKAGSSMYRRCAAGITPSRA